jgi:hypothetical protein
VALRAVASDSRAVAFNLRAVAFNLRAVAFNSRAVAPNLRAVAPNSRAVAFNLRAVAFNSRAVAPDLRAVASPVGYKTLVGNNRKTGNSPHHPGQGLARQPCCRHLPRSTLPTFWQGCKPTVYLSEPAKRHIQPERYANGLGDAAVHANGKGFVKVFAVSVGGHGDDGTEWASGRSRIRPVSLGMASSRLRIRFRRLLSSRR